MNKQPDALRLADAFERLPNIPITDLWWREGDNEAAAELRRLHAENDALRKQMESQKDEWLSWESKRRALEADAERWREWRKGNGLTVVVPTPTDDKPNRKVTVVYGPNPEPEYGKALDAAIDAAMKGTQ